MAEARTPKAATPASEEKLIDSTVLGPLFEFIDNSKKFLEGCTNQPGESEDGSKKAVSKTQYKQVVAITGVGFAILGLAGFLVKLVHIPINQILVGAA